MLLNTDKIEDISKTKQVWLCRHLSVWTLAYSKVGF